MPKDDIAGGKVANNADFGSAEKYWGVFNFIVFCIFAL